MILSIHQPAYLPWLGYFDKISRSDVFIYLDSVQFEKNSFTNRNFIKTPVGPLLLTVPVKTKGHTQSSMLTTEIDNRLDWKRKHLRSLKQHYRKAPRFETCFPRLEASYQSDHALLADFCYDHLLFWVRELSIPTQIVRSSTLSLSGRKSDLILELCERFGTDVYLSGALGQNYLEQDQFARRGITVEFQAFHCPKYPQLYGDFQPNLGVVDFWLNTDQVQLIRGAHA